MPDYYKILEDLDYIGMRQFFLENFIPKYVDTQIKDDRYVAFSNKYMYGSLVDFELTLAKYNFPKIEYFLIFVHYDDQPVHIDGYTEEVRHASLNLTITGDAGTKLNFYKVDGELKQEKSDARYMTNTDNLTCVDSLETDKWVLVNSGVPHNAVGIDPSDKRITVCFRFSGNPLFEELVAMSI